MTNNRAILVLGDETLSRIPAGPGTDKIAVGVNPSIVKTGRADAVTAGRARAALREATANIHEDLHGYPSFTRLMLGRLSLTEYSALLARLYGFYFPLERMLRMDAPASMSIDIVKREKAHLLHADLISVGMPSAEISLLPMCNSLPSIRSRENVMGCLYVIEGAGQGGTVMARKLDYLLGPESAAGRSFFLGRTDPDPLPWTVFCGLLETCAKEGNLGIIVESARGTFNAFSLWLSAEGCHA